MGTFRKFFGVCCFIYAAITVIWLCKLIILDVNILVGGFLAITAVSLVIDALVKRQEERVAGEKQAKDPAP